MTPAQLDAIAQANAFLSNAGLISYSDLIDSLLKKDVVANLVSEDVAPEHDAVIVALAQAGNKTAQTLLHWSA